MVKLLHFVPDLTHLKKFRCVLGYARMAREVASVLNEVLHLYGMGLVSIGGFCSVYFGNGMLSGVDEVVPKSFNVVHSRIVVLIQICAALPAS